MSEPKDDTVTVGKRSIQLTYAASISVIFAVAAAVYQGTQVLNELREIKRDSWHVSDMAEWTYQAHQLNTNNNFPDLSLVMRASRRAQ